MTLQKVGNYSIIRQQRYLFRILCCFYHRFYGILRSIIPKGNFGGINNGYKTYSSILKEYLNIYVITGYGLMVLSTILVILGLKGVPYKNEPIIESLGYIFVMILSNRILGEEITKKKIVGNGLILLGILVYYI
ncbi:EamA family transporter [Ruminococcus sp.]|uniref:EamA family transporter n=1 Tax=Ruminococcus sp. TaxID=41978 RepID=UPI0025FA0DDD|nr:EamA family transporter [Ruminococcus sp.]MBD9050648.1 hypothetical protein [Ruminococcus sp.]